MSEKDIEINIVTKADLAAVEATEKSIFKIEDAAKDASRELDVLEAKTRKENKDDTGGLTGLDLTGGLAGLGLGAKVANATGYGEELAKLKTLARTFGVELTGAVAADAALIAGSFTAIAASAVVAYKGVSDSLSDYKDLMTRWREVTGKELDEGSQDILAYAKVFEDIEQPIDDAIDKIGGLISRITEIAKNPLQALKDLRKEIDGTGDLEASIKRAEDMKKALNDIVQARAEAGQVELAEIYGEENDRLEDQERTLKRIGNLRSNLGNLEVAAASQEVESVKLRGGDVGLAEANVLATQLRTGLANLQQDLSETKTAADTAQRQAEAAMVAYNAAIRDKLDPAKITELGNKVDAAQGASNDAKQALSDQTQLFTAAKTNLIRGTENSLANLEQEYDGKTSTAAKQAFDGIYQNLQTAFSDGPKAALESIKVNAAAITQATAAKAGQVTASVDQIQTEVTRQSDGLLAKTQQANTDLAGATRALDGSVSGLAGNVESLLKVGTSLANSVAGQASRISSLESQVSALASRGY